MTYTVARRVADIARHYAHLMQPSANPRTIEVRNMGGWWRLEMRHQGQLVTFDDDNVALRYVDRHARPDATDGWWPPARATSR